MWLLRLLFWENVFPHSKHSWRSPECKLRMWSLRLLLKENFFPHSKHLWYSPACTLRMWLLSLLFQENFFSHCAHWYGSKILSQVLKLDEVFTILVTLILHYGDKCITKSLPSSRPFISYIEIWKMITISIAIEDVRPKTHIILNSYTNTNHLSNFYIWNERPGLGKTFSNTFITIVQH